MSSKGTGDGLWKLADGASSELRSEPEARVIGGPEIAPAGDRVAFSVDQRGRKLLHILSCDVLLALFTGDVARATPRATCDNRGALAMPRCDDARSIRITDGDDETHWPVMRARAGRSFVFCACQTGLLRHPPTC